MEYGKDYGKPEMMAVAIMREIREGDVVFHGLASPTPMVAMKAAKALGKEFAYVTLSDGLDHDWSKPPYCASTLTANTYEGSVAAFGLDCIFDLFCSGKGDIAFPVMPPDGQGGTHRHVLSSAEITNTRSSGDQGAREAPRSRPVTPRTTIWKTAHDKRTFVERVEFATTAPALDKLFTVITPLCIFRKQPGEKFLALDSIYPVHHGRGSERKYRSGKSRRQRLRPWIRQPPRNWLQSKRLT